MSEWQDIRTAPNDGTHVLLFSAWALAPRKGAPPGFYYIGYWSFCDEGPDRWLDPTDGMDIGEVTHWQPLPPPPPIQQAKSEVEG